MDFFRGCWFGSHGSMPAGLQARTDCGSEYGLQKDGQGERYGDSQTHSRFDSDRDSEIDCHSDLLGGLPSEPQIQFGHRPCDPVLEVFAGRVRATAANRQRWGSIGA
jgi:hypothetical protein